MAAERMRVHRALALAGVASRRAAEAMVAEGRVSVNGAPAAVGQLVGPSDALEVDGRPVQGPEQMRAYLLNKASGVVSTAHDPQGRETGLVLRLVHTRSLRHPDAQARRGDATRRRRGTRLLRRQRAGDIDPAAGERWRSGPPGEPA